MQQDAAMMLRLTNLLTAMEVCLRLGTYSSDRSELLLILSLFSSYTDKFGVSDKWQNKSCSIVFIFHIQTTMCLNYCQFLPQFAHFYWFKNVELRHPR